MSASAMPATAGIIRSQFAAAVEAWWNVPDDSAPLEDALMAVVEPVLAEIARLKTELAEKDGLLILAREVAFRS